MSEVLLSIQATALYPNSLIPHAAYPDKNRGSDRAKLQKLLATSVPDIDRVDSLVGKMDEARMAEVADYYLDVRGARPLAYGALNHARMREIPVAITCSAVPDRLARTMAAALRIYGLKTAEGFGYVTERQVNGLGLDQEQAGCNPWPLVQEFAAKVGAKRVITLGYEHELSQPTSVASEADHRIIDDNLAEYLKGHAYQMFHTVILIQELAAFGKGRQPSKCLPIVSVTRTSMPSQTLYSRTLCRLYVPDQPRFSYLADTLQVLAISS